MNKEDIKGNVMERSKKYMDRSKRYSLEQKRGRNVRVNFMVSTNEIQSIDEICKKLNLSRADYLRKVALSPNFEQIMNADIISGVLSTTIIELADFHVDWGKERFLIVHEKQEIYKTIPHGGLFRLPYTYLHIDGDTPEDIIYRSGILPSLKQDLIIDVDKFSTLVQLGFKPKGSISHDRFIDPIVYKHVRFPGVAILRIEAPETKSIKGFIFRNIYAAP